MSITNVNSMLSPGMFVRHPQMAEWGVGQVQSNINGRVTVMFPEEGKQVIDGTRIALDWVENET